MISAKEAQNLAAATVESKEAPTNDDQMKSDLEGLDGEIKKVIEAGGTEFFLDPLSYTLNDDHFAYLKKLKYSYNPETKILSW